MIPEVDETSGFPTVIWYDPGGTSGWSVFTVHPDSLTDPEIRVLDNVEHHICGEFYGDEYKQVDQMLDLADSWPGATLGTEQFVMYDSSRGRKDPALLTLVRLNAVLAYELRRHGRDRRLYRQNAQAAMREMPDNRLKACGYYNCSIGSAHARDADRHALIFLRALKANPTLRLECFPFLALEDES
jgi:hypothetical protein